MNMEKTPQSAAYAVASLRKKRWLTAVTVLAAVVVFVTTYALILPAVAMEHPEAYCGQQEHTHTGECYTRPLTCGQEESEAHAHNDACYTAVQGDLICENTDETHEHTEDCYAWTQELTCGQEESEGHTHTDGCYGEPELTCTLPEHTHTDECYVDPTPAPTPSTPETAAGVRTVTTGTATVTADAAEAALPASAALAVTEIDRDSDEMGELGMAVSYAMMQNGGAGINDARALDIGFVDAEGEPVAPAQDVTIKVAFAEPIEIQGEPSLWHVADEARTIEDEDYGELELRPAEAVETARFEYTEQDGVKLVTGYSFTSADFSAYVLVDAAAVETLATALTDTVSPSGTIINLFDYWVTNEKEGQVDSSDNNGTRAIPQNINNSQHRRTSFYNQKG